jgi:hypothetical protein
MFKMLSAVLFAGSLAFAQSDDLFSDDFQDAATADSIAHANAEATTQANEAAAQANIGNAKATSGQWDGFNYEDMGLTQWEYQQAKEQGVSREKLTKLVELGIRPTEYLQKPWNRLGVSEEDCGRDYSFTRFAGERDVDHTVEFDGWMSAAKALEGETLADKMFNHLLSKNIKADTLETIREKFVPGYHRAA